LKTAIIHDWLTGMRGGEKVVEAICELYPEADLYTLFHFKGAVSDTIEKMNIHTSFLQYMPFARKYYRYYLPFMPMAIEAFNVKNYDLIISSSHCVAKGVIPGKNAVHICYCHTPVRYAWEMYGQYFAIGNKPKGIKDFVIEGVMKYIRNWDIKTVGRVNHFVSNSENIKERIKRCYNREAAVIYPPVDTEYYGNKDIVDKREDYYLLAGAFAPYKRLDLAVEAFNKLGYRLVIIGQGQDEKKLRSLADKNIEFLGWQDDKKLYECYSKCKAFIFPGEEDFGIMPVETQLAGTPVIAYGKGGALETVIDGKTGVLFYEQTCEALIGAVKKFENMSFNRNAVRENGLRFNKARFKNEFKGFVDSKLQ